MHWIVLAIGVYVAAVTESSVSDLLVIGGVVPDLLALVLVARLLFGPTRQHLAVSFAVGLIADLTTPSQVGVGLASFLAIGWTVGRYGTSVVPGSAHWGVLIVLLATSGATFFSALARQILGETELLWIDLPLRSLGVGLYTAGFALPVLMVANWLREPAVLRRA
jgi:rod shape-determining protein MreD